MKIYTYYLPSLLFFAYSVIMLCKISYTDYLTGKIRNRSLAKLFSPTLAYLALLCIFSIIGLPGTADFQWFADYLTHIFISAVISFLMWKTGVWPAGDSKLFTMTAAMLPLIVRHSRLYPFILFASMLINIFVPSAMAFTGDALIVFFKDIKNKGLAETFCFDKSKASVMLGTVLAFLLCRYVSVLIGMSVNFSPAYQFLVIFLAWPVLYKLFKNIWMSSILAIAVCIYGAMCSSFASLMKEAMISFAYTVPLIALRKIIMLLMDRDSIEKINPERIRAGLILSEKYLKKIRKAMPSFYKKNLKKIYPEGLTEEQAESLKALFASGEKGIEKLLPAEARTGKPFAAWITAGFIFTCFMQGENIVSLIIEFWKIYISD